VPWGFKRDFNDRSREDSWRFKQLVEMFSGYKQSRSFTYDVFIAVESFVKDSEGRDIFEDLAMWDEGDLYRLVSAFLGLRFPMTLALNKEDIPTAAQYIKDIISQLPIHGAHRSVGVSAYNEMKFIRHQLSLAMRTSPLDTLSSQTQSIIHTMNGRVWDCLQSAMSLREPTFVFPVNDLKTYEPLPGMSNYATRDATLPNHGFISCITAAGGSAPSQWSIERKVYITEGKDAKQALRDVILMKPGSTVEHVFLALKGMGALHGEFVRAEAASMIGDKAKPVAKSDVVQRSNRILRIMTTKRSAWQKN
jgi:ribosome-binding ATPase YchF (GTP1/OBG family)